MSNSDHTPKESPIACDMGAIAAGQRDQHIANGGELLRAVTEILELPNGYAFRLPVERDSITRAAEFIALERLRCPFLRFALEVEAEGGDVWPWLTGREGVKAFVHEEVSGLLGGTINWTV